MSDQIGGVVWCSSGIFLGACCDGWLWLVQVECVPFDTGLAHLEAGKYHHQVLQLEPLKVCHHR